MSRFKPTRFGRAAHKGGAPQREAVPVTPGMMVGAAVDKMLLADFGHGERQLFWHQLAASVMKAVVSALGTHFVGVGLRLDANESATYVILPDADHTRRAEVIERVIEELRKAAHQERDAAVAGRAEKEPSK